MPRRHRSYQQAGNGANAGPDGETKRVIVDASNMAHAIGKSAARLANVRLIRDRIIRYMIVADEVVLQRRGKRRAR